MVTKPKQQTDSHSFKVGDVLVSSWGYGQTQVDWYRVKRLIGKSMLEISGIPGKQFHPGKPRKKVVYTDMSCHSLPDLKGSESPPERKRVAKDCGVKIHGSSYAYKWDGKSRYESWYY